MEFNHYSVLLNETIENLNIKPDGIYVDGTLGGAGHAQEVCRRLSAKGRFIGIDQDQDAIVAASERLSAYGDRVQIIRSNYCYMADELRSRGIEKVDGILLDLGVSSYQLDNEERGFSYRYDSPLDMRMDRSQSLTAEEILNYYDERKIFEIIRDFGEEKFAAKIAKNIVAFRSKQPLKTTGQLNEIIDASIPYAVRKKGGHPAKRTYQALRIAVNGELDGLDEALTELALSLTPGGRIAVLTFHSLEDRIVKQVFKYLEADCVCDKNAPVCVCGKRREIKILTKPISPDEREIADNPRAASAKLRAAERV